MTLEAKLWPHLICPLCGSDACAEMATKWMGEEIRVQCAICGHFGPRPDFSSVDEYSFILLLHQMTENMLERVAKQPYNPKKLGLDAALEK